MSFYARNFIYDSIISSEYGLTISSDNDSSVSGADVELHTQSIYRRPKAYLLGVQQTPVLSMPIYITVPLSLSSTESSVISRWLFGRTSYKRLQIIQYDMQYVYYNCIFTSPQIERVGNVIRGYRSKIVCDSPFAWEFPKTITYSYDGNTAYDDICINNTSDNDDYTYPEISFSINAYGGGLSIINTSDNNRKFVFYGLDANEVMTVNNDTQVISSSTGENRLPNFNDGATTPSDFYKWLRYVPGENRLSIEGNISSLSLTHQFARKMS